MKKNFRILLSLLPLIIALLPSCFSGDEFRSTIAKGMINSSEIRMDMTIQEIELKFGQPQEKTNVADWGYYNYTDFGIFFNNPLTYYDGDKLVATDPEENSIAFIRWYQDISIFEIIIDLTKMKTVFKKYGDPDKQYYLKPEDDDGTFSTGMKLYYISGKYALSYNYDNESKIVTYATLMPATMVPE